jgi:chemotaxis protein MotB
MIPFLHRLPTQAQEDNPLWLIVLADMMTNLMLFFLVMYALTQQTPAAREQWIKTFDASNVVDQSKVVRKPPPPESPEEVAAKKLKELFGDTSLTERLIRVRLQNQILFPSAQSLLSSEATVPLAKLAAVLKQMDNLVVIEGHTDNIRLTQSPYRSNWELSVARSNSVIEQLVSLGVPPERLIASGYGEFRPIAPNDTPSSRSLNRRVEVLILRAKATTNE